MKTGNREFFRERKDKFFGISRYTHVDNFANELQNC